MEDNRIRINEVMSEAKKRGSKVKQCEAAVETFPDSSNQHAAVVCLGNYQRGTSTKMDRKQILALSMIYDADPNQLFGWDEYQKNLRESEENP